MTAEQEHAIAVRWSLIAYVTGTTSASVVAANGNPFKIGTHGTRVHVIAR